MGLKQRLRDGEVVYGTFLNLGSSMTAELCGLAGFDWVLVDLEHGLGSDADLPGQLQAVRATPAAAAVRVQSNSRPLFARALDLGAEAVMVPRVDTVGHARAAAAALRFPPQGERGVARMHRASAFGRDVAGMLRTANDQVVGIVQVESVAAVAEVDGIAQVDGVDVLFVGPSDLSHAMGIFGQTGHPRFTSALDAVSAAARAAGKATGILVQTAEDARRYADRGFQFIGVSSDGGLLAAGAAATVAALRPG